MTPTSNAAESKISCIFCHIQSNAHYAVRLAMQKRIGQLHFPPKQSFKPKPPLKTARQLSWNKMLIGTAFSRPSGGYSRDQWHASK